MNRRLHISILCLAAIVFFLIAGALPFGKSDTSPTVIFESPVFVLLNGILFILLVVCSFLSFRKSLRYLWLFLTHVGCALILLGAFMSYLGEKEMGLVVPTDGKTSGFSEQQMMNPDNTGKSLLSEIGFDIFCSQFQIDYFPVDTYELFERQEDSPPVFVMKAKLGEKILDLGKYGKINLEDLKAQEGGFQGWKLFYPITDKLFLLIGKPTDKEYFCSLKCISVDGRELALKTSVNHPAVFGKWRLYLMDYDHKKNSYVILAARSDPGRSFVIFGIWMLMAGMFGICYLSPCSKPNDNTLISGSEGRAI